MTNKKKFRPRSLETSSIHRKIGTAFFLMALIPILLMLYMVFFHLPDVSRDESTVNLRWLVFLSICSALAGYYIVRKIASSLAAIDKTAKAIVESGTKGELKVSEQSEEIRGLVKTFNQVTNNLEDQIVKLKHSKQLIQDLLQKVGNVLTSGTKIEDLLELIMKSMVNALDSESGILLFFDEEKKKFKTKVAFGKKRDALLDLATDGDGFFGFWVREKNTLIVNKSSESEDSSDDFSYKSFICVPLKYQGNVLGHVIVFNKKTGEGFNHDDELLLEHVTTQVAVVAENSRLNRDAERVYVETIAALAVAVEERDTYTRGHIQRVAENSVNIAKEMGLSEKEIQTLRDGAFLHDIGKIAIEDRILLKKERLTPEEMEIMKTHAAVGEKIIAPLSSFKDIREIVRHHQEWFDGTGYPDGAKGNEISLSARILTVADVYDSLTTDRPYRKGSSKEEAVQMISKESGTHFDPEVVKIFLKISKSKHS